MRRVCWCFLALIAVCGAATAADFRLDPVHTQIFFSVSHTGYSRSTGALHVKNGFFSFDADDWSKAKVDATIDTASLDMGNEAWSKKVQSSFFDVSTFPTAHYVGDKVEKTGDRNGVVHGKLTLLGRSVPVDLKITFNRAGADGYTLHYIAGFSADATFKRSAFGMTRSDKDIGDDVNVHLEVEGIRDGDAAKTAPNAQEQH